MFLSKLIAHTQCQKSSPKRNPPVGELMAIDATRIAVGKKVFKSKCELKFQFGTKFPYMMFSFNTGEGKKRSHKVSLKGDEELRGLNYYTPIESDNNDGNITDGVDDSMAIIAFRIAPTESNQFTLYSKSYKYDDDDSYVTVEVRDNDDFAVSNSVSLLGACLKYRHETILKIILLFTGDA